jgi:uncharacterized protein involved in exopolysaccharide biosynthesis
MNTRRLLAAARPYWRVPMVALLGGLLAFFASFAVPASYESQTRLLIRGRDATVLNADGSNLGDQPGVIDSNLAIALGSTQSALASSTAVAEAVVDHLKLDERKEPTGPVGFAKKVVAGTFKRTRAYLAHGFYKAPSKHQQAVDDVHSGLSAAALKDSYVLELTGHANEAQLAADVTDAAADALIAVSGDRSRTEAASERDFLATQVTRAQADVDAALAAKRDYETARGISQLPLELQLGTVSLGDLRKDLSATEVEISATSAELASTRTQLAATPQSSSSVQDVTTGRSSTEISSSSTSPVYTQLLIQRNSLESKIASLQARANAVSRRITGNDASASNSEEAELSKLDATLVATQRAYEKLDSAYEDAIVTAARPGVELTRIGTASVPTFPVGPLRYVYLALGLLCGALAGWGITWLRDRRLRPPGPVDPTWYGADLDQTASNGAPRPGPMPAPVLAVTGAAGETRTQVGAFEVFTAPTAPASARD